MGTEVDEAGAEALTPFVGRHHADLIASGAPWDERDATLLFADVAGFTALNERLARRGREGAELMVALLDEVFGRLIDTAAGYGGDLLKFGGDALLVMFDGENHAQRAAYAACAMQSELHHRTDAHRAIGRVTVGMSMGLESGPVALLLCGQVTPELIALGPTLDATLAAETEAQGGEIAIGPDAARRLATFAMRDRDGVRVLAPLDPSRGHPFDLPQDARIPAAIRARGISPELQAHLADPGRFPEHRPVTSAFVRFRADASDLSATQAQLDELTTTVQHLCDDHGVAFLIADAGGGGGKFLLTGGAPRSLGDSTERVLDLAIELVGRVGTKVAVGVNAGTVFCGEVGSDQRRCYATIGDPVNLAARVMARAQPGEVLCEAATLSRWAPRFRTHPVEPFAAKGKAALVEASLVEGRADRSLPPTDEGDTAVPPGRDRQLAQLVEAHRQAVAGQTAIVEVVADAGMGKSTLVAAASARFEVGTQLVVTGGRYLQLSPFAALAPPLRHALGLPALGDPSEAARLEELVSRVDPTLLPWLPLLAVPLGIEVAPTPESEAVDPAFRLAVLNRRLSKLLKETVAAPLVLVVDDAQWLDESTSDVLRHLVSSGGSGPPALLVAGRRPVSGGLDLADLDPVRIELGPLDDADARLVVRQHAPLLDAHLVPRIIERAGGNPLFLLALAGVAGGADADLPDTIEDALRAELDRCRPDVRQVLGRAAALGMRSEVSLVSRLLDVGEPAARAALAEGHLFVELAGPEYRFRHPLRQEAAYAALPFADRRDAHRRAADAISAGSDDPPPALLSLHYHRSRQYDEAWRWSRLAAERARASFATATVADELERARDAARHARNVSRLDRAAVLEELADAKEVLGHFADAEQHLRAALRLDPSPPATVRRMTKVARTCRSTGELGRGLRWCGRAERLAHDLSGSSLAFPLRERAALLFRKGDLTGSLEANRSAAEVARAARDRPQLAEALKGIGTIQELLGIGGVREMTAAVRLSERCGDDRGAAAALVNLGAAYYDRGRWDRSVEMYRRAGQTAERFGDLILAATAFNNLAEIHSDRGDLDLARPLFEEALTTWRSLGYTIGVGVALNNLGRLARRDGRFADAGTLFDEAVTTFEAAGAADFVAEVALRRFELALATGDLAGAERAAETCAEAVAADPSNGPFVVGAARLDGVLASRLGNPGRAAARISEALDAAASHRLGYEEALTLEASLACGCAPRGAAKRLAGRLEHLQVRSTGQEHLWSS